MNLKKKFQILFTMILFSSLSVVIIGCSTIGGNSLIKKSVSNLSVPTINDLISVAFAHDDLTIVQSLLEADLILLDTLCENSPNNMELLAITSKLYGYYSYGFVVVDEYEEIGDEERKYMLNRARKLYWRGIDKGMRALKTNKKFRKALEKKIPFNESLKFLSKKDLPAAYGVAFNMGLNLICSLDVPQILALQNDYVDLTKWLIETDATFEYGTAHILLGVFYSIMPAVGGGGPEKAKLEFDKGIKICPDFLLNHFLYARYYPTLILDEQTFDRQLNYILNSSMEKLASARALNEVALKKAKSINLNRNFYF